VLQANKGRTTNDNNNPIRKDMSVTKEIVEKENKRIHTDCQALHLHREGTFLLRHKLFLFFYGV
jgi:hypothetical protein